MEIYDLHGKVVPTGSGKVLNTLKRTGKREFNSRSNSIVGYRHVFEEIIYFRIAQQSGIVERRNLWNLRNLLNMAFTEAQTNHYHCGIHVMLSSRFSLNIFPLIDSTHVDRVRHLK